MNSQTSLRIALGFSLMVTLLGCGGGAGSASTGEGGGSGSGGGGTSTTSVSFTASVTAISLEDTRTGQQVVVDGLPIAGATVTRD